MGDSYSEFFKDWKTYGIFFQLDGKVREANDTAKKLGATPGLSGRQALEIMAKA